MKLGKFFIIIYFLLTSNISYEQIDNFSLSKLLPSDFFNKKGKNIFIYDNHHYEDNIQRIIAKVVEVLSTNTSINYYVENNPIELILYNKYLALDSFNLTSLHFNSFTFISYDRTKYKDSLESKIKKNEINIYGFDNYCFNEHTIEVIIDSTKKELISHNSSQINFLLSEDVKDIIKLAYSLNTYLSIIEMVEYEKFYKAYQYVVKNTKSDFIKNAWENLNHFFIWVLNRGYLLPKKNFGNITPYEAMNWHKYRDSMMFINLNKMLKKIDRQNVIVVGSSHCKRQGLKYKGIGAGVFSNSLTDYFEINNSRIDHKLLVTNDSLADINKISKKLIFTPFVIDGINVKMITPINESERSKLYFKLSNYGNSVVIANWFKAFDRILLVEKVQKN